MDTIVKLHQHIEPLPQPLDRGKYIGNQRCHINSLSYALKNPKQVKSIIGCLQVFSDKSGVAHFVVELNDGTIIDTTYGNCVSKLYLYLIPIERYSPDAFKPNRDLRNLKAHLHRQLPWYIRWFTSADNM